MLDDNGQSFSNKLDAELARIAENMKDKYLIIQERSLSYRFYLHQHPYVQPLVQRLLRKGASGLQAADTEYNTRIKFTNAIAVNDSLGKSIQLAAGEVAYLADGATATLKSDGTAVRFAGSRVLRLLDNTPVTPGANKEVTIPDKTSVRVSKGSVVTTKANATAALIDGGPLPVLYSEIFSAEHYNPSDLVKHRPIKDLDFSPSGAYAVYNWELFFHVPITIAIHLSKNQRFAEAQRWFHYLFDPTDDSDGQTPERFWKVRPFQTTDVKKIEEILVNLVTGEDEELRKETIRSLEAWIDAPFRPHVIARYRQQSYMYQTVMAYLDNLIAWGDSLFRQDTGEAIDEALQLYVLAANILGPRPLPVPKKGNVRPQTYANLRQDLAQFGTVMRDMEPDLPFDLMPFPTDNHGDTEQLVTLRGLGKALYFCVPRNDKLLSYWDTVGDRLFKIRNSLNIHGVFRQLALFDPPIDPAMLARAGAAGLDVGAIVNGLNQPLPLVRFQLLVQKAAEIVQEVKSLGNNLLSAMEKEDGEAMAILRARHERIVMEMVEQVKYGQLQEAIKSKEGLMQNLALAARRYRYYERLLGKPDSEIKIPELDELDNASLEKLKLKTTEPEVQAHEENLAKAIAGAQIPFVPMNLWEGGEIAMLTAGHAAQILSLSLDTLASLLALVPEGQVRITPWGMGAGVTFGGKALSTAASFAAKSASAVATDANFMASMSGKIGSYARRAQEWEFQSNLAAGEINQIFKQLRAAQIREAIAELEVRNHRQQMNHAEEIERFLNEEGTEKIGKKTNKALYTWMKREVKGLYGQCFQFAFDIARKAERALQHELGNPELSYIQFGYLAGKEGLLAGEKLYLDIKRMEMAYYDQNQREYELTRHISLLQVDPLALIKLRMTGQCTVTLSESLFDMDGPGHYFRRIKNVAVSIPCVAGPYASVNCTLTLLKSSIRKTPSVGDQYGRVDTEDDRFSDNFGSLQSIVTSSAQNDSGLFETNLRDERYLPFENSGVISEWRLQLPADPSRSDPAHFDYDTISDVILHVRYTAREGGSLLRTGAITRLKELITMAQTIGSVRLFSVRHEFPTEWAKFTKQSPGNNQRYELTLNFRPEHYPFWSQGRLNGVTRVNVLARSTATPVPAKVQIADKADKSDATAKKDELHKDPAQGNLLVGKLEQISPPRDSQNNVSPTGELKLFFDDRTMADLWIAVTWNE